nr:glycosyltransferase family 4 protein [Lachnospiraceae bacterium]
HKIPYISWSDGTAYSERNIGLLQKYARKYIIKNSKAFIASSSKTKENQILLGAREDKIFISELSIDLNNYAKAGLDRTQNNNLIFVGTLIERKGLDLLFDALNLIQDTDWRLFIAGEGHDRDKLVHYAKELSLEDRVEFKGFVAGKELIRLYENSSIFILPTREDCFGLVILEAMCCGLPVISSKYADGAYDLIEEGENGYIIDPCDPVTFSEKIKKLLNDKELCRKMGKRSREKTGEFDFSITGKAYIDAINSVF